MRINEEIFFDILKRNCNKIEKPALWFDIEDWIKNTVSCKTMYMQGSIRGGNRRLSCF